MYFFARNWRIVSKSACFALEGSHFAPRSMLRNSVGPSLLRGRLGVQVVVDHHTIHDSFRPDGAGCHQEVHAWTRARDYVAFGAACPQEGTQ